MLTISNNLIGTNLTRRNYRNDNGIVLSGVGDNNATAGVPGDDTFTIDDVTIQDNMIAYSRNNGIAIRGANAVQVIDNTLTLNGVGVAVGDNGGGSYSSDVDVLGNEITRSGGNGIYVSEGSENVVIGTTTAGEGNQIGTNSTGRRGLGNRANGVMVESAGPGISLEGNAIVGNGARRTSAGRNGVRISNQAGSVTINENEISMNRGAGVFADGATTVADVTKNTIFRNYGSGVELDSTVFANIVLGSLTPTGAVPTDEGNFIISNRRFGIDASGGEASIGGNSMLGNRRGGIDSTVAAPTIASATLSGTTLTVEFGVAVPATSEIHLYVGTGRSSRSQGLTYIGTVTGNGGTSYTFAGLAPELRVRIGTSITATVTDTVGAGTSEFARNVSVRRP
jgi:hypothetical protein